MTTLRREVIKTLYNQIVSSEFFSGASAHWEEYDQWTKETSLEAAKKFSASLADAILSLRGFSFLATDEERPEYNVENAPTETQEAPKAGSEAWKALKRSELEKTNPELSLFRGELPQKAALDASVSRLGALETFERDMRFNPLPWDSDAAWQKFSKFVVKEHEKDPLIFAKYKTWQENEGKYQSLSNRKIRQKPQEFIDCFPDFLAHSVMYRKPAEQVANVSRNTLQYDEDGRLITY